MYHSELIAFIDFLLLIINLNQTHVLSYSTYNPSIVIESIYYTIAPHPLPTYRPTYLHAFHVYKNHVCHTFIQLLCHSTSQNNQPTGRSINHHHHLHLSILHNQTIQQSNSNPSIHLSILHNQITKSNNNYNRKDFQCKIGSST